MPKSYPLKEKPSLEGPIGIFDSGFGGLNILREIRKILPSHDFVYLGDTARAPYGSRSKEVVYQFTKQGIDFLFQQNCRLIILACNTASSDTLRKIQKKYLPETYPDRRVLGVIIPATEWATEMNKNKKVGVIATEGTVNSRAFIREFAKKDPSIKVFQKSCPLLVPLVEAGEHNSKATNIILENYLAPLRKKKINSLILGCTHYGILREKIQKIVGPNIKVISEDKIVAYKLKNYLDRHPEINKRLNKKGKLKIYSTDTTGNFRKLGGKFLGQPIKVAKATLD